MESAAGIVCGSVGAWRGDRQAGGAWVLPIGVGMRVGLRASGPRHENIFLHCMFIDVDPGRGSGAWSRRVR